MRVMLFGLMLLFLTPALAGDQSVKDSPAARYIRSVKYNLKVIRKRIATKPDKWWQNREKNLNGVISDLEKTKKDLKKIKELDPSWDVSDLEKGLQEGQARVDKALSVVNQKEGNQKQALKNINEFKADIRAMGATARLVHKLSKKEYPFEPPARMLNKWNQAERLMAPFADKCKKVYLPAMKATDSWSKSYWMAAEKWQKELCQAAVDIEALFTAWTHHSVSRLKEESEKMVQSRLADLQDKGEWDEWAASYFKDFKKHVASERKKYQELFVKIGKPMPKNILEGSANRFKKDYKKALKTGLTKTFFKAGINKDASSSQAVRKLLKKQGLKVLKVTQTGDWTVQTDYLKRPVSRSIGNRVLAKAKGEGHCRIYELASVQKYAGSWTGSVRDVIKGEQTTYRVARCK